MGSLISKRCLVAECQSVGLYLYGPLVRSVRVPPPNPRGCSAQHASTDLVDAYALSAIRHAILAFAAIAINSGKVVQLGRRIRPNRFRAFLPIRRTYFPMFILSVRPSK